MNESKFETTGQSESSMEQRESEVYLEEMAKFVRDEIAKLQSSNELPVEIMGEKDRVYLITSLINALSRGQCLDDDVAKREWIFRAVSAIYEANKR